MVRKGWLMILICIVMTQLTGCGFKSAGGIAEDLAGRSKEMESYISHGKMTMKTGEEPLVYDIDVWYKKPDFYRVALKNTKNDIEQILLRNKEGVFVLTPHLSNSSRFQSDWPKTSGAIYLYQSLIENITEDSDRKFKSENNEYRFEVASKYAANEDLKRQIIVLDNDLYPKRVDVVNGAKKVLISMTFDRFELNPSFDNDAFSAKRNMQAVQPDKSTIVSERGTQVQMITGAVDPAFTPADSHLEELSTIDTPVGPVVLMRYDGKVKFTITQRKPEERVFKHFAKGTIIDIQGTPAILSTSQKEKRLSWIYDGVAYEINGKLNDKVMEKIASSLIRKETK